VEARECARLPPPPDHGHPNVAGTMVDDKEDAGAKGDEAEARTEDADDHQPARTCASRLAPDGHPNVVGTMVDDEQDAGAKEDEAEAADDADDQGGGGKKVRQATINSIHYVYTHTVVSYGGGRGEHCQRRTCCVGAPAAAAAAATNATAAGTPAAGKYVSVCAFAICVCVCVFVCVLLRILLYAYISRQCVYVHRYVRHHRGLHME
jgi:hypothetical protein